MKKVGIIHREYDHFTLNKELCKVLEEHQILVVGIVPDRYFKTALLNVDGVILQGGTTYTQKDLEIVSYLYDQNIKTLGICLGMQIMSVFFDGSLGKIQNHNRKEPYVHEVKIQKNSKLYEILKKDQIKVNSRHQDYVINTSLSPCAISSDGIIEAVEDKEKDFFLGVQWHPESLQDENAQALFQAFFQSL